MLDNVERVAEFRCPGTELRIAIFHPDNVCFVCGYIKEAHNEVQRNDGPDEGSK